MNTTTPRATGAGADRLDRREATSVFMREVPDALVVTGLGSPSYDVFASGRQEGVFYLWGAMGGAVPLGLGLALAQPSRSVVVVTGDGEQLMGIGALATVGACRPPNLSILVLDNGHFGETGMQPSHTSMGVDLASVARACGIADSSQVTELRELLVVAERVKARAAPLFVQVLVDHAAHPRALPPRDGAANKNAFRAALGLATF